VGAPAPRRLLVLGGGGHGKVVADAADRQGAWAEIAFLDDRCTPGERICDWPVVGRFADAPGLCGPGTDFAIALGDNRARLDWSSRLLAAGGSLATVVHPHACVSRRATLGAGTVIAAGAVVNPGARLGRVVIVNTGATVDHDCEVGDGVHVSPGAHLGGTVRVGEGAWVGIGASVRHGTRIGAAATVGAGAAVVADVPAGETVVGVPARRR
jgi:sugar O-acyltransferase (sialic acid O-acetyltransferase NeuD family)